MSDSREMSMAGPSGMYVPRTPRSSVRDEKRRILDREREKPHGTRKLYHFVMGAICFTLYGVVLPEKTALWTLAIVGGAFVVLDLLRLRWPWLNRLALKFFGKLMRREELTTLTANSWYVLGLLAAGLLFPKPYALLGLAFLAVGDPTAAVVGTRWGKVPLRSGKSLEGTLANFVASAVVAFFTALWLFKLNGADALLVAFVGGAASAVAEAAPTPVNDNFAIPVISAGLLLLVLRIVGLSL